MFKLFIDSFLVISVKHLLLTQPPWASKRCRWFRTTCHSDNRQDWKV